MQHMVHADVNNLVAFGCQRLLEKLWGSSTATHWQYWQYTAPPFTWVPCLCACTAAAALRWQYWQLKHQVQGPYCLAQYKDTTHARPPHLCKHYQGPHLCG
jgi:hypothetical protein